MQILLGADALSYHCRLEAGEISLEEVIREVAGLRVQYCYPGEGVADLASLMNVLVSEDRAEPYLLSVEGLDNYAGVANQPERLAASFDLLRKLSSGNGTPQSVAGKVAS